jgi:peptide/nickel transport system permease protein
MIVVGVLIHLGKRLVGGAVMVLVVASFTFYLIHMIPGNPAEAKYLSLVSLGMSPNEAMAQVRIMYGFIPHEPLGVQYFQYMSQLFHLNLGVSISYTGIPVVRLIAQAAPWTLVLGILGLVASFIMGMVFGALAAIRRSSPLGNFLTVTGSLLHGIPQFIIALLLAYLFTTIWPIFPFGAPYDATVSPGFNWPFLSSVAVHAVLPVAAYAISSYGGFMLAMKSSVVSTLGDDFILAAELRGISPGIRFRYIARNAILPLFTILTLSFGFIFGGSLFIENIFDYPGLGNLINNAISSTDWPLMAGTFLIITAAVIAANILADLLYTVVDPRIRRQ